MADERALLNAAREGALRDVQRLMKAGTSRNCANGFGYASVRRALGSFCGVFPFDSPLRVPDSRFPRGQETPGAGTADSKGLEWESGPRGRREGITRDILRGPQTGGCD